jgi:tetratricopeptide (TPR) repeat protein
MNRLSFTNWYKTTGSLRISLLAMAVFVKVILYIFNPPYYISKEILLYPFTILVALDIAGLLAGSIIIVELIRIIAYRSTLSWSLKKHFFVLFTFIMVISVINVLFVFPKKSIHYYNFGWTLTEEKNYEQAKLYLDIAVQYNPKNIKAYIERGTVHRELGDFISALNDYNKVIEVDSKNTTAYEGKGYVYYYLEDFDNALREWETAIAFDPQRLSRLEKWIEAANERL